MKRGFLAVVLLLSVVVAGCVAPANQPLNSGKADSVVVMTSFYPLYIMTLNVTDGVSGVKVVNLTPPQTGCLHDYQLKPSDMKNLSSAQILIVNGADMESFMDKVVKQYPELKVITASEGASLLTDRAGEINPHLWVSISGAAYEVEQIAKGLAAADPRHANQYRENAGRYLDKLKAQQDKMRAELAGVKSRNIVTFHEAFPYFAQEFNLNVIAVVEREPGSEPSAAELAATVEMVKESGVRALFAEPQYSSRAANVISRETGARVYTLDPGVTGPDHPDAYLQAMDKNLDVLKEALR